jgi:hypothetical protein
LPPFTGGHAAPVREEFTMRSVLLCLSLGCTALAQSVVVPNANANARGNGALNVLDPLQTNMLGMSAAELAAIPIGSAIVGMSFRPGASTSTRPSWPLTDETYATFDVTIGYAQPLANWTTTFSANFTNTPIPPMLVRSGPLVLDAGTYLVVGTQPPLPNPWGDFFFEFHRPFPYLGGDLAIHFVHPRPMNTGAPLVDMLTTNPTAGVYRGATTLNATTGSSFGFPITRLHYGYGSGCPGTGGKLPGLVLTNDTSGGGTASFALANAPATAVAAYAFGLVRASVLLPNGCTLLTPPVALVPVALNAKGRHLLSLTVAATVFGSVEVQGAVLDAGANGGFTLTNGVTFTAR